MDRLVVMFGGSGFIGRYVAQALLAAGARVRFAERDPRRAWFLKPLGNLGQTQFVAADVTRPESVARALQGADAVINLVGAFDDMERRQHLGAKAVAEAAAGAGAGALVHISAIGADPAAESAYYRTKGLGEEAVRKAFPGATILRPSIVFGPEDRFTNRFAALMRIAPLLPQIRGGARFQPVYVGDVAQAAAAALLDPARHGGKTYELAGPEVLSMAEMNAFLAKATGRSPVVVDVPDFAARALARLTGWAPGAPITWDQWLMLQKDNVAAPDAEGLAAFGIAPTPLAAVAPGWLVQYRRHGRFGGVKRAA